MAPPHPGDGSRAVRTPHAPQSPPRGNRRRRQRQLPAIALAVTALAALLASLALASGSSSPPPASPPNTERAATARLPPGTQRLYIGRPAHVHPIAPGFLGLSLEYKAIEAYAGTDSSAVNPVFEQLVRNLNPGQRPVLRIGGDSTDWTWWPVNGMSRPGGVRYSLTPTWLDVTNTLAQDLHARLILGINLEANSQRVTREEANVLVHSLPQDSIEGLEPGNEPELYSSWTYYTTADGQKVMGRPPGYSFTDFEQDFASVHDLLPDWPLAGPTTGGVHWLRDVPAFIADEPSAKVVTVHSYPLQRCYIPRGSPHYPSIPHLLAASASRGLATSLRPYVLVAHQHGRKIRVDEMNTVGCGNGPGVDNTFATALWVLDTLSAMANAGLDGVNVHTYQNAPYELFTFSRSGGQWTGHVNPEYYGLLMFALAEPPGSRPLALSGPGTRALSAWATRGRDGKTRIVLINESHRPRQIALGANSASGPAAVVRLLASSLTASTHVRLGNQSFARATTTGTLNGPVQATMFQPSNGTFRVRVPAASAALVVLP